MDELLNVRSKVVEYIHKWNNFPSTFIDQLRKETKSGLKCVCHYFILLLSSFFFDWEELY